MSRPTPPARPRNLDNSAAFDLPPARPRSWLGPVALALVAGVALAAPDGHAAPTPASVAKQLTAITSAAVKGTRVDYGVVEAKRTALDALVKDIGATSLKGVSQHERLAFYINAYNAHVLQAVLDAGLIKNGRGVGKGVLDSPGFFDKATHVTASKTMTLNTLEEKFIRSQKDPRIHFAVNCASIDCPPLHSVAYTGRKLSGALDRQTKAYLTRKGAVTFDDATQVVTVVKLFEWYAKDWGTDADIRAFLFKYVGDERVKTYKIATRAYDWHLNTAK